MKLTNTQLNSLQSRVGIRMFASQEFKLLIEAIEESKIPYSAVAGNLRLGKSICSYTLDLRVKKKDGMLDLTLDTKTFAKKMKTVGKLFKPTEVKAVIVIDTIPNNLSASAHEEMADIINQNFNYPHSVDIIDFIKDQDKATSNIFIFAK